MVSSYTPTPSDIDTLRQGWRSEMREEDTQETLLPRLQLGASKRASDTWRRELQLKGTLHIRYPLIAKFISPLVGRSDFKTASHQLCITRNNSTNVAPQTPYRYQSSKEPCLGLLSFIDLFSDPDHDQKVYFAFNPKLLRFLLRPRTRRPRVYAATSGRHTLCLRVKTFDSSARLHQNHSREIHHSDIAGAN